MKAADFHFPTRLRRIAPAAAWLVAAFSAAALAATTDISNAPLFTSSSAQIKPNIMFILDDSGSMASKFLPDEANFSISVYGFRAPQCNGVAYDPRVTYNPPVDSTGVVQAAGSKGFMEPSAQVNTGSNNPTVDLPLTTPRTLSDIAAGTWPTAAGQTVALTVTAGSKQSSWYSTAGSQEVTVYGSGSKFFTGVVTAWNSSTGAISIKVWDVVGTGALTSPLIAYGVANTYFSYGGTQRKLGYAYDATANLITSSTFYQECSSSIGSTPGSNVFTAHSVGTASTDAQNYANWYAYYRTRMDMMQTAMTWAFKGIDDRYRVGFTTISSTSVTEGTKFLNIRDFDATQKASFYTKLNAAAPGSTTPLRGALAKAGQYYAKKAPGQTFDPIQYSCQRNFTLLSTDGYWNTGTETTTYGAFQLDGTTKVGQQDGGGTLRPMFDGGSVTRTTTETWTVTTVTGTRTTQPSVTTSTLTTSTTTTAPTSATSGQQQGIFTLVPEFTVDGSKLTRNNNVVTVTVAGGHNLVTGDNVAINASNNGSFNNGFRDTNGTTVTVLSPTQFTYVSSGSNGTASGTYAVFPGAVNCSGSQAVQRSQTQVRDAVTMTTVYATDTTTQGSTTTFTTTKTDVTPWSRVIKSVNGTVVSDTGPVAGTLTSRSVNSASTVTTGTAVTTHQANTPAQTTATGFSPWIVTTSGTVSSTCRSSPSAPGTITQNLPSTTTSTAVANAPTNAGPTTTNGTAIVVTTSGPTSTESPIPHASVSAVTSTSGGTSNTLADVAMYYYQTDLRDSGLGNCTGSLGADVCTNNVPGSTNDAAHSYGDAVKWQHMTTFTLGLGASGLLRYDPNYLTQLSGDFFDITNTSKNWPSPVETTSGGEPQNIDDLWHAAVNGRGQYFSAGDPTTLTNSLNSALDSIKSVTGAASAASTSSLQPVQGDNDIYVAQFTTQTWVGDVLSFRIDPTTGQISSTPTWSAKAQLDTLTPASRTIYYANPTGSSTLRTFTYANLSSDGYNGLFDNFCSQVGANGSGNPQQCASLGSTDRSSANTGGNLVNYIRGDQTQSYYRSRTNLLGDVINASPLFIGKPGFRYTENDYQTFVTNKATRQAVVLAAANDGMLHAFDRTTGNELWSFIPTLVMRNLYKLADTNYANNHSYFVDGSPQMGDIFVGGAWKTIVVGGLNAGGRGYYALDVTDPANPKLLWEFGVSQNSNLGLSFGNPIITKRADGTWVVVFASGYNNVSPGDGNGHLFVLNANTGAVLTDVQTYSTGTTAVGSSSTPSGLAKINDWVDAETVNTAKRFYGGDMLGNLWRFDIDGIVAPNNAALRLAQFTGPTGAAQPVTTKPAVAEVNYNGSRYPVVYVATGRYLGSSDLADTNVQSIYAMKDPLINSSYGVVRTNSNFVTQTITVSGTDRTSTSNRVDWVTKSGWMVDLPAGERVSVNPALALETLFVGSNLPSSNSCTVGGDSFLYQFNIGTGTSTSNYVGNVMIQGLTLVQLTTGAASGSVVSIITRSDGSLQSLVGAPSTSTTNLRRTSWRELSE